MKFNDPVAKELREKASHAGKLPDKENPTPANQPGDDSESEEE